MDENESIRREHRYCLQRVRELEPAYLELRSTLTPAQQTILDAYIAACEALTEAELLLLQ